MYLHLNCVLMLNWFDWNGPVFEIETLLTVKWIALYRFWFNDNHLNIDIVHHHHHHHLALVARISLTLSRHSSLSFIALGRSSGQHPVSSHSCWMYVRAGRPAFARPCVEVHKSTSHYEFVPASPAVSCMSGSSNLNSFRDRGQVAVQLVSCGVLPPGLV